MNLSEIKNKIKKKAKKSDNIPKSLRIYEKSKDNKKVNLTETK